MSKRAFLKVAAALLGVGALTAVGGMALADTEHGEDDVIVTADIKKPKIQGVLAMDVASNSASLTESGSTALVRQFVGDLPEVRVYDTRDPDDIPDDVYWYVLGTATDFEGDASQPDIPAGNLGWEPDLVDPGESGGVAPGPRVDTLLDSPPNNVGLVDTEFLMQTIDASADVASDEEWTATAALFLKTPATVEPGVYTSTLTLSLFE
jgi:hypothetical protein